MEGIYRWVSNIVYYLIFMTIITNLLPAGKYEKYLRLFAGCILILLVIQPLTGSLRLEEKINAIFRSVTFENEAGELKGELDAMEQKRLERMIGRYEEAAQEELLRMAQEEGLEAAEASVVIEQDSQSPDFGKVKKILLKFKKKDEAENEPAQTAAEGSVERISLEEVERVSVRLDGKSAEEGADANRADEKGAEPEDGHGNRRDKADAAPAAGRVIAQQEVYGPDTEALRQFRRTIAGYYQMEEENVEIGLED